MESEPVTDNRKIYRFSNCSLNVSSRELFRDGKLVTVQAQVFDLLCYLLKRPNQVQDKSTLLDAVWKNQFLSDAAIAQAIRKARAAVGDDGKTQAIIKTVHGKGFAFVAEVISEDEVNPPILTEPSPASPPPASPTPVPRPTSRFWIAGLVAIVMVIGGAWLTWFDNDAAIVPDQSEPKSRIVILPFVNSTNEERLAWLELGMSETTGLLLEQTSDLQVTRSRDIEDIAAADLNSVRTVLGADYALQAEVSIQNGKYQIDLNLVGPEGVDQNSSFETAELTTISRQIVESSLRTIQKQPNAPIMNQPLLDDPLALELYGRGIQALYKDDREQAQNYLKVAQLRSPEVAWFKVALAIAQFDTTDAKNSIEQYQLIRDTLPESEVMARARMDYEIGTRLWFSGDVTESGVILSLILEQKDIDPALMAMTLNSLSFVRQSQMQFQQAWEQAKQSEVLSRQINDPYLLSMVLTNQAYMAEDLGRIHQSAQLHQQALDIRNKYNFEGLIAASQYGLARTLRRSGKFAEAQGLLEQALATVKKLSLVFDEFDNLEELAEVQMRLGQFDLANANIDQAHALAESVDDELGLTWTKQMRVRLQRFDKTLNESSVVMQKQVISALENMGELQQAFHAQLELVQIWLDLGDINHAKDLLKTLPDIMQEQNPVFDLQLSTLKAQVLENHEDQSTALQKSLVQARNIGVIDLEVEIALLIADIAVQQREPELARRMLTICNAWSPGYFPAKAISEQIAAMP